MLYSDKLRRFADWLDAHPKVSSELSGEWDYPAVYLPIMNEDWERFQTVVSDLDGFQKSGYGGSLEARHVERSTEEGTSNERLFVVTVSVSGVCERKPKLDDDGNPVTHTVPATEASTVVEYEYDCPKTWLS